MSALVAAGCGALLVGGAAAFAHGLRRTPAPMPNRRTPESFAQAWARLTRRPAGRRGLIRDSLLLIGLVTGFGGYLLTGWELLLLLAPVGFVAVPYLLGDPPNPELEMLASLDRWIRQMAATLQVGQSIADALRTSAHNPPPLLAEGVRRLVARLDNRWSVQDAVQALADEVDTPDADAVLAALSLAAHRGGTGASATLKALSESVQDRLRALRDIEAERAKPRVVVRQVTVISLTVLGASLMLGGEFFAPYRSGIGELILVVLIAAYLGALLAMRRMTAPPRRQRILQQGSS